jgi:type II secretory pathway predicted ATPase ExeA
MNRSQLTYFSLKFNPFSASLPIEALLMQPQPDAFCRRIEASLGDGGFAIVTGEPGCGKSVVLRLLAHRLSAYRDVVVATIDHPQSKPLDFYRELGDCFGVPLSMVNRWGGFKALRARWADHIASCHLRPVLIIDEAQQMLDSVFTEVRILSSKDFDSESLLSVVFAGDSRLTDRFRHPDMIPLGTRIRRRLVIDYATREELHACLAHVLDAAGNPALLSKPLQDALVDHAAGNYRVMMNTADELLAAAFERQTPVLDEKLFFDVFAVQPRKRSARKR